MFYSFPFGMMGVFMYFLNGCKELVETFYALAFPYKKSIANLSDLKSGMIGFLNHAQPDIPHPLNYETEKFIFDSEKISSFISLFLGKDILTDLEGKVILSERSSMESALSEMRKALTEIKNKNPELFDIFDIAIHSLFYAKSSDQGGGSVSTAIGIIWCANKKNWTLQDRIEFLIHELTHNLLFLDELRFSHYTDVVALGKQENYCISSILKMPRPLDKVAHSLVVASEIVLARQNWLGNPKNPIVHPPTEEILENIHTTLKSLYSMPHKGLFTDRMWALIDRIAKRHYPKKTILFRNVAA